MDGSTNIAQLSDAFEQVYRDGRWGTGIGSGHGSRRWATMPYRRFLESFIRTNGVRSVVDFGCGDWEVGRLVDWNGAQYLGLDVVPRLVEGNQHRFGSGRVRFMMTPEDPSEIPASHLLICKDVLQHLPIDVIRTFLDHVVPRCTMTLIIDDQPGTPDETNIEIPAGGWRRVDVRQPPFNAPATVIRTLLMPPALTRSFQRMRAGRKTIMLLRS